VPGDISLPSTDDLPTITIVIPARNEAAYVTRPLESVVGQNYPMEKLACIVVDNGSVDETALTVRDFASATSGPKITLVYEDTPGVGRAKNAGAALASASILLFLDADSRLGLTLTHEVAAKYLAGYRAGSIRVVADGGCWLDRAFFNIMEFGKTHFGIRAQMLYCERELFIRLGGFNTELHLGEDVDLLHRANRMLRSSGLPPVCHVSTAEIATSPRRLAANHHLGMASMFGRWLLAFFGLGRRSSY
jgi:glycosyltransferase involved in cell wall biosynthesis